MEPHELIYEEPPPHDHFLSGLARECPECGVVDHYDVKGRKPVEVKCHCGHFFTVQKYKKGQRPQPKTCSCDSPEWIHGVTHCGKCFCKIPFWKHPKYKQLRGR